MIEYIIVDGNFVQPPDDLENNEMCLEKELHYNSSNVTYMSAILSNHLGTITWNYIYITCVIYTLYYKILKYIDLPIVENDDNNNKKDSVMSECLEDGEIHDNESNINEINKNIDQSKDAKVW